MTDLSTPQPSLPSREPVAFINALVAVIEAGIALLVAFGLDLSLQETGAIMAFVFAMATLIQTYWARSLVTPVCSIDEE